MVLIRDTGFDFSILHMLPWQFLRLSDIKILLSTKELPSEGCRRDGLCFLHDLRSGDLKPLKAMISQIAELSQYWKFFGREVALDLYDKWLSNSLSGQVADHCFFVRSEEADQLAGFVAVKMEEKVAEATLVAVGKEFRGSGIGQCFLSNVLFELGEIGAEMCRVGTQITNRSALNFYNSLGFRFDSYRADFILYQASPDFSISRLGG